MKTEQLIDKRFPIEPYMDFEHQFHFECDCVLGFALCKMDVNQISFQEHDPFQESKVSEL